MWLAACEPLAWALHALTRAMGSWPGALLATGDSAWPVVCATFGGGLLALALAPARSLDARIRRVRFPWLYHAALACGARSRHSRLALALLAQPLAPPPGKWWLVVIDVGQGDALALAGPDGWWLVDTGPRSPHWDAGESAVLPFLRWAALRELKLLVLTHDDGDHTGGATAVQRGIARARDWSPRRRARACRDRACALVRHLSRVATCCRASRSRSCCGRRCRARPTKRSRAAATTRRRSCSRWARDRPRAAHGRCRQPGRGRTRGRAAAGRAQGRAPRFGLFERCGVRCAAASGTRGHLGRRAQRLRPSEPDRARAPARERRDASNAPTTRARSGTSSARMASAGSTGGMASRGARRSSAPRPLEARPLRAPFDRRRTSFGALAARFAPG